MIVSGVRWTVVTILICMQISVIAQSDSLRIPRLVIKTSVDPIFLVVNAASSADIGCETRITNRLSVDCNVGMVLPELFRKQHENRRGYYLSVSLRRYFLKRNGLYLSMWYQFGEKQKSQTAEFMMPTVYFKRTHVTHSYHAIFPNVGWHGSVFPRNKFPLDFSVGPWLEFRQFSFTNFNAQELAAVQAGNVRGLDDRPERPFRFLLMIWIDIGIVTHR